MRVLRWLWPVWGVQRGLLAAAFALTLVYTACHLSYPYVVKLAIDGITEDLEPRVLLVYGILILGLGGGASVLYGVLQAVRSRVNIGTERIVRVRVFGHLTRLGGSFFNRFLSGDLITRLTNDISERITWFSCSGVFRLLEAVLTLTVGIAVMLTIQWKLTLLAVVPLPLVLLGFRLLTMRFRRGYERLQAAASSQNGVLESALSGIRVVKAYGEEPRQRRLFGAALDERVAAELSLVKIHSLFHAIGALVGELGMVLILGAGCLMVMNETMTLGALVAFTVYMRLILEPLWGIGFFLPAMRRADVSIGRLDEIESARPDVTDGAGTAGGTGPVEAAFEGVHYAYPGAPGSGLRDVDLAVPRGARLGIVGPVGSGKSTLLNLLLRAFDPDSGRVVVDGRDARDQPLAALRAGAGYVPQEPFLFSDTVRANILLGREGIGEQDVERAVGAARFDADVQALPGGLDQPLGPRGITLSGGQKQRLSLARALAGRPRLLVLDDVTSNLDGETEEALWQGIEEAYSGVTILASSHRNATMRRMDLLAVLDGGRVVEQGTHEELLARKGLYADLFRRQVLEEELAEEGAGGRTQEAG